MSVAVEATSPAQPQRTIDSTMALILLMLVSIFSYLDRTIISILQVPIKRDLGLSDAELGALTGLAFALIYATMAVPIGRLADRLNRKLVIVASLAFWSIMTALSGLATGFAMLVFFRIGVALGEAGSAPATHSLLADHFPPAQRATALGIWGLALPIGVMLGYLAGGWLAAAIDWRAAMAIVGGVGVLLSPVILLLLREPPRGRFDTGPVVGPPPLREALAMLWRRRSMRLFLVGGALNNFVLSVMLNWNAPFYVRMHDLSLGEVATALALMTGIGGAIGIFLGGWLTDRTGAADPARRPRVTGWVMIAVTPLALLQLLAPSTLVSLAAGTGVIMLLFFYYAPIVSCTMSVVPASIRAFTSAILLLAVNIFGLGLGPWLTGLLSDALGPDPGSLRTAMAAMSLMCVAGGACFLLAARYYKDDIV